jgi:hypothetical protein
MVYRKALRLGALAFTFLSMATSASAQHKNPQLLRSSSASISAPFSPFGNNITFNKYGDDGSSCILDASGLLIWVDSSGNYRIVQNSELSVPLAVSNNELIVWKNRFADYDYYPNKADLQVSLFRADSSGLLTESVITMEGKEVLDTAALTTTTGSFLLVTTERVDNQVTETGAGNTVDNVISGTVAEVVYLGASTQVHVDVGESAALVVDVPNHSGPQSVGYQPGRAVSWVCAPDAVRVLHRSPSTVVAATAGKAD